MFEDSYFFKDLEDTEINNEKIFLAIEDYSKSLQKQIYVVYRALPTKNNYTYKKSCLLIIPYTKLLFLNFDSSSQNDFYNYVDDFIDDLGYLSEKFGYKDKLGRTRSWLGLYEKINADQLSSLISKIERYQDIEQFALRKIEILTSLIIGSVNDPAKVSLEIPDTFIKKIKNKIILYDGTQSSFIYQNINDNKIIRIQGLAGTGKTELLVQKIREKYVNERDSKISYVCHNNVLWQDMKKRIPELFDFMKVDEQIKTNERLWIMKSWGNSNDFNSGLCIFICRKYDIPFKSYYKSYDLEKFSNDLLRELKSRSIQPCFDYLFIDEGQDFNKNFIDLCNLVTSKKIYIAGDIFQNIFDTGFSKVEADYVLNKCYRTDPRTLMFAHAVGMGLYESPVLRWLSDSEWNLCGYKIDKDNGKYFLTRKPIRRFEDIDDTNDNMVIKPCIYAEIQNTIIDSIVEIKTENSDLEARDIAIVFVETDFVSMCTLVSSIKVKIYEKFGWLTNIGYETKTRDDENKIFISNTNNIKGLEFPFVIVVATTYIASSLQSRNSIYMALTRSFIKSYFIINKEYEVNERFISIYSDAISSIKNKNAIIINEPSREDKEKINKNLGEITKKRNREIVYSKIKNDFRFDDKEIDAIKLLSSKAASNDSLSDEDFYKYLYNIVNEMNEYK